MSPLIQKIWRRIELMESPVRKLRKLALRLRGAQIGAGTQVPRVFMTWPHQVKLGCDCVVQPEVFFNFSHYWAPGPTMVFGDRVFIGRGCEFNILRGLSVGDDCLIASGCSFIDSNHGTDPQRPMNAQPLDTAPIKLGRNVWLGAGCIVLKGVQIGDGAIIGAGSVLTKSVPAGEIWAGVPARPLRHATANN